jgi:hypothetical protein
MYQQIMIFVKEELPAKGWSVMKMQPIKDYVPIPLYLEGDKLENTVRRFLQLPTVQHDRRKADQLLREIQAKNAAEEKAKGDDQK